MANMKLTAEQKITRTLIWMMRSPNFMGMYPLAMIGNIKVVRNAREWPNGTKTAYTDGRNMRFWHEFVDSVSEKVLRHAVLHETAHIMGRHCLNYGHLYKQNPSKALRATDQWVNNMIHAHNDSDIEMWEHAVRDDKYADPSRWDVTQIFKDLPDSPYQCTGNCKPDDGTGGQPSEGCTCPPQTECCQDMSSGQGMSPEEQRLLAQEIDQAIRQGQRLASQQGGNKDLAIGELLRVKTDWRAATRDFLTSFVKGGDELSWRRINRRSVGSDGELMPGSIQESMGELAIWNDASGSISQHELTLFLSHIVHITKTIKPIKITIAFWDTEVHGHQTFEPHQYDSLLKTVVAKGGGGTEVNCVHAYMKKHKMTPEVNIILSDGYLSSPPKDFGIRTLWGVVGNPGFTAPSPQKTLHLSDGWSE